MSVDRIIVSIDDLEKALRIWLRTSPPAIWRADEAYEKLRAEKHHDPDRAPDPKRDLAAYIAGRFRQAGWEVSQDRRGNPFTGLGGEPIE